MRRGQCFKAAGIEAKEGKRKGRKGRRQRRGSGTNGIARVSGWATRWGRVQGAGQRVRVRGRWGIVIIKGQRAIRCWSA